MRGYPTLWTNGSANSTHMTQQPLTAGGQAGEGSLTPPCDPDRGLQETCGVLAELRRVSIRSREAQD